MRRREIFKYLGLLGGSSAFSMFVLPNEKEEAFYSRFDCFSKIYPQKHYTNIDDFWKDHPDKKAYELNQAFISLGLIKHINTKLLSDGKTVRVEKVFRNRFYSKLYTSSWVRLSKGYPKEYTHLNYKNFT